MTEGQPSDHPTTRINNPTSELRILRLPDVLARFPVSRSAWFAGVADGRYPRSVKLGARAVGWKSCDIDKLIQSLPQD